MKYEHNDGGRKKAGYTGSAGDCFVRALAIVTGKSYKEIYDSVNLATTQERDRKGNRKSNARTGVTGKLARRVAAVYGGSWVPTMQIGQGCKVHLKADELPEGRLMVSLSKHYAAVIDGVVLDNHDPRREGTRCVYGYWLFPLLVKAPVVELSEEEAEANAKFDALDPVDKIVYRALYDEQIATGSEAGYSDTDTQRLTVMLEGTEGIKVTIGNVATAISNLKRAGLVTDLLTPGIADNGGSETLLYTLHHGEDWKLPAEKEEPAVDATNEALQDARRLIVDVAEGKTGYNELQARALVLACSFKVQGIGISNEHSCEERKIKIRIRDGGEIFRCGECGKEVAA